MLTFGFLHTKVRKNMTNLKDDLPLFTTLLDWRKRGMCLNSARDRVELITQIPSKCQH